MQREKADMSTEDFKRAMEWVKYFANKGTQDELSITGIGEALLHPKWLEFFHYAREQYKGKILFSTNGILFDDLAAITCKELGVQVYISMHRPEMAAPAVNLCRKYNLSAAVNDAFVVSSFNWAGQVDWEVSAPKTSCEYLRNGWGVVLQNGKVSTCCLDSEEQGVVGHIDDPLGSISVKPYELCKSCHMYIANSEDFEKKITFTSGDEKVITFAPHKGKA